MGFKQAVRGTRSTSSVKRFTINPKAKVLNFSSAVAKEVDKFKYVVLGYDEKEEHIGLSFSNDKAVNAFEVNKKTKAISARTLASTFNLNFSDIAGSYTDKALSGPVKVKDFGDNVYILKVGERTKPEVNAAPVTQAAAETEPKIEGK